jgi:HK97 family phage prohead protease
MIPVTLSGRSASLPAGSGVRASDVKSRRADVSALRTDRAGRIRGYASLFGAMDLGRDVVMPGAFRDSISRRGAAGIRLLWSHDAREPIGHWETIREDQRGLYVEGQLDLGLARGRDIHTLVNKGRLDGLSIGFRSESERREPATGIRHLERIDLWEVSLVPFPLLPQARLLDLKGADCGFPGVAFRLAPTCRIAASF